LHSVTPQSDNFLWSTITNDNFFTAIRHYEQCSDLSSASSNCFGWRLQIGCSVPIDFTIAAEFFKKAADSNYPDGSNSFGCCLEQGQGVDIDIDWATSYYQRAASRFHSDGMYNFGRCLEYGRGIPQNQIHAAKYYRLAADRDNLTAENSFGICLERGIGVHKDLMLAAQYYQRAAKHGHLDGANNFGFCLEHGRGVQQNIQMASEYYKFASDHGHSEAKLNHKRCLRLLSKWEPPDRSSDAISHPPNPNHLSAIIHDLLKIPGPFNDHRLLNIFQPLTIPIKIPLISNSSIVKWILDKLGNGNSSVVKLSFDSKSNLIVVKTSQNSDHAELIQWETIFLKTLKHPLILKLHNHQNSMIVTEFARNGSLMNHLSSSQCPLSGANRITKVIVGIALAMRFIHSNSIIHRNLNPENILLEWDWNVWITGFNQSSSSLDPVCQPLSIDSRYYAPECYDCEYVQESDVFSFGTILYEIMTGRSVLSKKLTRFQIAVKVAVTYKRPLIPESVLPFTRQLINQCWEEKPENRPSFEEIVERLKKIKFKVMENVNSAKLAEFVKKIEEFERKNSGIQQ
jgi:TPR repeat protein